MQIGPRDFIYGRKNLEFLSMGVIHTFHYKVDSARELIEFLKITYHCFRSKCLMLFVTQTERKAENSSLVEQNQSNNTSYIANTYFYTI